MTLFDPPISSLEQARDIMRSSGRYTVAPELWRDVRVAIFPHLQRNADPLKDVSGGGFDLDLDATNPPSWVTGNLGPVLSYPAAPDKASFASGVSISVADESQYTIATWVKFTSSANIVSYGEGRSADSTPRLTVEAISGTLRFLHQDDASALGFGASTGTYNDGHWHLHVGSRDGDQFRNYVDGVLDGSGTGTLGTTTIDDVRYGLVTLGGTDVLFWSGDLGPVVTWSRTLDPQAIQRLHRDPFVMLRRQRRKAFWAPISAGQPFRIRGMMVPGWAGGRFGRVA